MENIFRILGISVLLIFSFLYVININDFLIKRNSLYIEIKNNKSLYEKKEVNALINGEYITPGVCGKKVNLKKSFFNLRAYNSFNYKFLIFNDSVPSVSIINNLDKYIENGSLLKRNIALIISSNKVVEKFLTNKNIPTSKLITLENFDKTTLEKINNDSKNFKYLSKFIDNKICVVNNENENICRENKFYLIKPKIYVNNENIIIIKENISSGQIIFIEDDLSLDNFMNLYNEILFKGYTLVTLSDIISEH